MFWVIVVIGTTFWMGDVESKIVDYKFTTKEECLSWITNDKDRHSNLNKKIRGVGLHNLQLMCVELPVEWLNRDLDDD